MRLSRPPDSASSFVEFPDQIGSTNSLDKFPKNAVAEYIHELCVTLSYMSNAKQCGRLTELLSAAADEAAKQMDEAGLDRVQDCEASHGASAPYSAARET